MALQTGQLPIVIEVAIEEVVESAASLARSYEEVGFHVDREFPPIPMNSGSAGSIQSVLIRGTIPPERMLNLDSMDRVINVWLDTSVSLFCGAGAPRPFCPIRPCDCDFSPKGNARDVVKSLEVPKAWKAGFHGQGVAIGIVDSGIEAAGKVPSGGLPNVVGGYPGDWGTKSIHLHGNMVAFNSLQVAPRVKLYDLRIVDVAGVDLLSNAAQAFQWALIQYRHNGEPQVLSCSWGISRSAVDPVYARDTGHFFTRKVREVVNEGICVLFAAGNCGPACPFLECGSEYGPDCSIWGANGSPDVLTVGAVNVDSHLIGYSSCGPAALHHYKPDVCGISEFVGYWPSGDLGTSAACPVIAGVVSLLKSKNIALSPAQLKAALLGTAHQIGGLSGWNAFSGFGVVDAWAALQKV